MYYKVHMRMSRDVCSFVFGQMITGLSLTILILLDEYHDTIAVCCIIIIRFTYSSYEKQDEKLLE